MTFASARSALLVPGSSFKKTCVFGIGLQVGWRSLWAVALAAETPEVSHLDYWVTLVEEHAFAVANLWWSCGIGLLSHVSRGPQRMTVVSAQAASAVRLNYTILNVHSILVMVFVLLTFYNQNWVFVILVQSRLKPLYTFGIKKKFTDLQITYRVYRR